MWTLPKEPRRGDSLAKIIRKFFNDEVKISKENRSRAKKLVKDYVEDEIIPYCKRNSPLPLLRLEYTGSMYEGLKCEAADEVDLMVILHTTDLEVVVDTSEVPGYAKLRADVNSTFRRYADPWGYIIPAQIRLAWFYSLVIKAKNAFEMKFPPSPVCLRVSTHGPAVKLDHISIDDTGAKETLLSVDLVLCFQIGPDDYFVAKPYEGRTPVCNAELLWRQSFSLKEKKLLKGMDKDRRELLRTVKTILKRETTFARLTSYHLKTAFIHYMTTNTTENLSGDRSLEEHFLGFLGALQNYLTNRQLPNYWQPRINLLQDINQKVLENMAFRLAKIKRKATRFQETCDKILLSQKLREYSATHRTTRHETDSRVVQKALFSSHGSQRLQFFNSDERTCMVELFSELFLVVTTTIQRDGVLYLLSSHDVNQAFDHYCCITPPDGFRNGDSALGEHFLSFMSTLHGLLMKGHLLERTSKGSISLVANRCTRIIESEDERNKLLGGEISWVWPWVQADDSLTRKLRDYSFSYVKVHEVDMASTRELVKDVVEGQVMRYCLQNSKLPIRKVEFTGSAYEGLQTDAAEKVSVMVVLKTTKSWLWWQEVETEFTYVPWYVRLKTRRRSKFRKYADPEGYIDAEQLSSGWLYSLVAQAVQYSSERWSSTSDVNLAVYTNGPVVELDVIKKQTDEILLTADLIPCFQVESGDFFVAKPYSRTPASSHELHWRQSFSLKEKEMLESMDGDDNGCRHKLFRIVKTIVTWEPGSLGRLPSYHLKTAFMHYISKHHQMWDRENALADHFLGFLGELQISLEKRNLPHRWLHGVNLLGDIDRELLEKMANRLERILNSRTEMNEILLANQTYWFPNSRC